MFKRSMLIKMALGLVLMLGVCLFSESAFAQEEKKTGGLDKKQGTKKGVANSLAESEIDEDKIPGKLEAGIAAGSCVAMIIVVKWL